MLAATSVLTAQPISHCHTDKAHNVITQGDINRKHAIGILLGLTGFSLLIRLFIIFSSGELLHMDGQEYFDFAQNVRTPLVNGDWQAAFNVPVFSHWGCILSGLIPLILKPAWLTDREALAVFFSLPATMNIGLIYWAMRRFGCQQRAALIGAALYTFSFSALYHVRYVHPNDLSIMFFLLGSIVTLKNPSRPYRMPLAGALFFLCFFTYYGYWTLAFLGMLFVTCYRARNFANLVSHGCIASAGLLAPLLLFFLIGHYYGANYLNHFMVFSSTITMGDFESGHAIPFLFFWHAEGMLSLVWGACLLLAFRQIHQQAVKYCLIAISLMYLIFISCSNWLEQFVVYGRLVKAMTPMLCIIAACVLADTKRWQLFLLLGCLAPGYLWNAWQIHNAALWTDVAVQQAHLTRQFGDTSNIVMSAECSTNSAICPDYASKGCTVLWRFLPADTLPFNAYDSQTAQDREFFKQVHHGVILACPKDAPPDHP